jgi:arylformamidase
VFIRLSYDLSADGPGWPGNPKLESHWHTSMDSGDIVNHTVFTLFTHFGPHLDAPLHWQQHGESVTDLTIDRFIYLSPVAIDIPKGPQELITATEIEAHRAAILDKDCLLIRTGFSRYRQGDANTYSARGPALAPAAAQYVMDSFPTLKAIGTDCISIASPAMIDEAIETHRILCGYHDPGRSLIILEDFSLDFDLTHLKRIYALPLFLKGAEGSPCTIVAEVDTD